VIGGPLPHLDYPSPGCQKSDTLQEVDMMALLSSAKTTWEKPWVPSSAGGADPAGEECDIGFSIFRVVLSEVSMDLLAGECALYSIL